MTATDELRRMLDERGVEWHGDIATYWGGADAVESLFADNALDVSLYAISPEQAIEATLGETPTPPPPTPPEQPPYDVLIDLLRDEWDIEVMWDGLRRFWYVGLTDGGVRKRDEREATLGRGTCRRVLYKPTNVLVCTECGAGMPKQLDKYCFLHFCPNCGRKVVES